MTSSKDDFINSTIKTSIKENTTTQIEFISTHTEIFTTLDSTSKISSNTETLISSSNTQTNPITLPYDYVGLVFNLSTDNLDTITDVSALVLLRDNLFACSKDRTIFLADYVSGVIKFAERAHRDETKALVAFNNKTIFASGSFDKTIKIWNATSGNCLFTFNSSNGGHDDKVVYLTTLGDDLLVSGTLSDKSLKIWNVSLGSLVFTLNNLDIMQALVSLENFNVNLFATSSMTDIKIWNASTGILTRVLKTGNSFLNAKSLSTIKNQNNLLACGLLNGNILFWNLSSGLLEFELNGHTSQVNFLISLENNLLASGSWDGSIRVWNLTSGQNKFVFNKNNGGNSGLITALTSLEYNLLASTGLGDYDIRIWDLSLGLLKHRFNKSIGGHCQGINVLTSLGNNMLASGAIRGQWAFLGPLDGLVKIWHVI